MISRICPFPLRVPRLALHPRTLLALSRRSLVLTHPNSICGKHLTIHCWPVPLLLHDFADRSCTHRATAFSDREAQALFHSHWCDQFDCECHVVARHHHLCAFRQLCYAGHVRGSEVEL